MQMNSPLNILFVEDSADDAQLVMLQLEQNGLIANCHRVDSEAEFIAALDPTPDLILSDYSLPGFNGPRALQIIRERALDIPFILISGTIGEEVAVEAMKQGADDYLMKDRLTRLGPAIKSALNRKRLREEKIRADLALRHSEERYHNIFQTAPVSIWEEDFTEVKALLDNLRAQGVTDFRAHLKDHPELAEHAVQMVKVVDVNETTLRLYGAKDKTELLGDLGKFLGPDEFHEELIALAEGKTYIEKETTAYTAHGESLHLWLTQTFFTGEDGRYKALVCLNDITERKRAEEALREKETQIRVLSDNLPNGYVYQVDFGLHGELRRFNYVSAGVERMHGISVQQVLDDPLILYGQMLEEDRVRALEMEAAAFASMTIFKAEARYRMGADQIGWMLLTSTPCKLDNNHILWDGIALDITEHKQAEQALRESEALYRRAIEVAGAVPYQQSYPSEEFHINYEFIGEGIRQLTGYGADEFNEAVWDSLVQESHLLGELTKYSMKEAAHRVRTGASPIWKCEHRIRHRNGEIRWVFESAVELRDEHGDSHGSIGMFQDITERKLAEAALRESQQRLSLFFNQSLDGFFFSMLDEPIEWNDTSDKENLLDYVITHQRITEANEAMLEQYGSTRAKFMGRTASDFFAHDLEQARHFRRNLFDQGHLHIDTEERKDDGTPIWIEGDYVCMRDDQNRISGMFGIQRDATLRKKAEEALRESENRFRNLVERLSQVIYTSELGANGVWSYASPQIEKLLGFTPQEWMSDLWSQQVHPDDLDKQNELEQQAHQRGEPFEGEYRIKTRDGKWIWVRDSGQILPPQGSDAPIVQGMLMDITERKQAEEALNLSRAQLLANLENTPNVAVQWYDEQGRILYLNPASETLYGQKSEEAFGKTLDQIIHTPEEQAEFMRILAEIRATGKAYGPYEAQVHPPGGGVSWVLATTFSLPMNEDRIGFVCMDVDITRLKQAEEQIQKQLSRLNALHTIDMAINSSMDMQITLDVLLNQALYQLNADAAALLLFNQPTQSLELAASRGFRANPLGRSPLRLSDGFAGKVINERRAVHIPNMMEAGRGLKQITSLASEAFVEYYAVPLIAKGQIKGVLEVFQRSSTERSPEWLNFLEVLGGQAAIAIDNSQLVQSLHRSNMEIFAAYDATIEGWSRAMDLRDKETEGHTQRVTTMTVKLARAVGISEADIIHIQRGGLLHDMGKLGVPDNILLKAGSLTEEEWEIMRQHPTFALNMLAPIAYLKNAIDIPYCHHEKWDGTGYPRRLKGDQIPLAARIFAIADVWDALASDRPYRTAWSHEKVLAYIKEQSGKHFDPQVVEAFLKMTASEP